jgi:hypothetical protein
MDMGLGLLGELARDIRKHVITRITRRGREDSPNYWSFECSLYLLRQCGTLHWFGEDWEDSLSLFEPLR